MIKYTGSIYKNFYNVWCFVALIISCMNINNNVFISLVSTVIQKSQEKCYIIVLNVLPLCMDLDNLKIKKIIDPLKDDSIPSEKICL